MRSKRTVARPTHPFLAVLAALLLVGLMAVPAGGQGASPTNPWNGINGVEHLDNLCDVGEDPFIHWVLVHGPRLGDVDLEVNGDNYEMTRRGSSRTFHATTDFYEEPAAEAVRRISRTNAGGGLTISDACGPEPEPEPEGRVTVLKDWEFGEGTEDRDDLADLGATFRIRKDNIVLQDPVADGYTFENLPLSTLIEIIGEYITGLPDDCEYTHDGYSGKAWTVTETAPIGTITLTNRVTCDVPEPPVVVEEQALRLVKFFFDADGARVTAPEGDWSATVAVGGVAKIELSGTTTSGWANISGNYTVAETSIAGWSEVSCDGFTLPDIGTEYLDVSGTGSFTLDQAEGAHAVCNQAAEVEVLPEVIEKPEVEAEVKAEVLEELPVTGTQASLLALLTVLGLGSIGLGTVLARRR